MSDQPNEKDQDRDGGPAYTPAHPIKRIVAWVGIVCIVCVLGLKLYPFFHGGDYLSEVAPLFACPGIAGLLAIGLCSLRQKDAPYSKKASMAVLALVCVVGLIVSLALGIPPVMEGVVG